MRCDNNVNTQNQHDIYRAIIWRIYETHDTETEKILIYEKYVQ